jgi:transposase
MDNLGSHKSRAVRTAIHQAGAHLFFLPPYSPDLNPIEMAFSKLKTFLRKANVRSQSQVTQAIQKYFQPSPQTNAETIFVTQAMRHHDHKRL